MEFLKSFFVGLIVLIGSIFMILTALILAPLLLVTGTILLLAFKTVLFIVLVIAVVTLIGHFVRKGLQKAKL